LTTNLSLCLLTMLLDGAAHYFLIVHGTIFAQLIHGLGPGINVH